MSAASNAISFSQKYYELDMPDGRLFCIPLRLLPDNLRDLALKTDKISHEMSIDPTERQREWKKKSAKFYEVVSIKPLTINKMKTVDFYNYYKQSLLDHLKIRLENQSLSNQVQLIEQKEYPSFSIKIKEASALTLPFSEEEKGMIERGNIITAQVSYQARLEVHQQLEILKNRLKEIINSYGKNIFPNERFQVLWESLSLQMISEESYSTEDKKKLYKIIFQYWSEVHWSLHQMLCAGALNIPVESQFHLTAIIEKLSNLRNYVVQRFAVNCNSLISRLLTIQKPLYQILKNAQKYRGLLAENFYLQFNQFFRLKIRDLGHCILRADSSRKMIREWIEFRCQMICLYSEMIFESRKDMAAFNFHLEKELLIDIESKNWFAIHRKVSLLDERLMNMLTSFYTLKAGTSVLGNEHRILECKNELSYRFSNLKVIVEAFLNDFEYVIKEGKIFHLVSEVAYERIKESWGIISKPLNKSTRSVSGLLNWAWTLHRHKCPELFDAIKLMQTSWSELKAIREEINDKTLENSLNHLMEAIKKEQPELIISRFFEMLPIMGSALFKWHNSLEQLNSHVEDVQRLSVLCLMDHNLPQIEVGTLKTSFEAFNERLGELIKPVTLFLNALQQLICIDKVESNAEEITLQLNPAARLSLLLFSTDEDYFLDLASSISQLREGQKESWEIHFESEEIVDVETNEPEPLADPNVPAPLDNLSQNIKEIFGHTKTRKIWSDLKVLFKEYGLSVKTKFGKGDHEKLYVNGIPIPMPKHTEWAPGTAKSIQNELLDRLRETMAQ